MDTMTGRQENIGIVVVV